MKNRFSKMQKLCSKMGKYKVIGALKNLNKQ